MKLRIGLIIGFLATGFSLFGQYDISKRDVTILDDLIFTDTTNFVNQPKMDSARIADTAKYALSVEPTYFNTEIVVGNSGAQYTTIKAALASITDNDSTHRYTIKVLPGNYYEDNPVQMKNYVSVIGVGGVASSVIYPQNSGSAFNFDRISSMSGFTIIDAEKALQFDSIGNNQVTDLVINSCDTGFAMNNPYSYVYANDIYLASGNSKIDIGFLCQAGSLNTSDLTVISNDSVGNVFKIKGSNAHANIVSLRCGSVNIDTAVHAVDTAKVLMTGCIIAYVKNGLVSLNYSELRFNNGTHYSITESFTTVDQTSMLAGYANNNDNDHALVIEGQELHVGDAAQGYEVCIGQGDSYSDDLLAYMYDGSTYWSLGDTLKNIDAISVSFPNLTANTAIYFASDIDTIIHHGIKIAVTDSLTIGTGEVVAEYWNGSAWTEFNAMVTDSDAPYAYRSKSYFEQTQSTQLRYDIEITNDDWIANDPMSYGSVKKWIRFRIATAITESPELDQIKLHTSRMEINADGFLEYFGDARNTELLPLGIGTGQPFEGNMQSQTIYIDENLGVGFQNNRFTATNDKLGYAVNFPDNIDTGCPLYLVFSGRYVTGGTAQWTVRYKIFSYGETLYTTEPAASGDVQTYVINATVTAAVNEIFVAELDISEALPTIPDSFGDQLWISLQPTTLPGSFDLTNIGAEYYSWSPGGHF